MKDKNKKNKEMKTSLENPDADVAEIKNKEEVGEQAPPIVKKKRNIFLRILNVAAFLLLLFVIFETVIAFLNFNLIQNKEEPKYFVEKSFDTEVIDGETVNYTIWSMRLYKIIREDTERNYEIRLLPFFLDM